MKSLSFQLRDIGRSSSNNSSMSSSSLASPSTGSSAETTAGGGEEWRHCGQRSARVGAAAKQQAWLPSVSTNFAVPIAEETVY